jgi:hypothetical protein
MQKFAKREPNFCFWGFLLRLPTFSQHFSFQVVTIQGAHILVQKGPFSAILRLFFQPMRCIAFKK